MTTGDRAKYPHLGAPFTPDDVARLRVIFADDMRALAIVDEYERAEAAYGVARDEENHHYGTSGEAYWRVIRVRRRGRADGLAAALRVMVEYLGPVRDGRPLDVGARVILPGTGRWFEVLDMSVSTPVFGATEVRFRAVDVDGRR